MKIFHLDVTILLFKFIRNAQCNKKSIFGFFCIVPRSACVVGPGSSNLHHRRVYRECIHRVCTKRKLTCLVINRKACLIIKRLKLRCILHPACNIGNTRNRRFVLPFNSIAPCFIIVIIIILCAGIYCKRRCDIEPVIQCIEGMF